MNVVTFYSYKGGVGRTNALANVGYKLALEGQRVLLVDFDLEAPSLNAENFFPRVVDPEIPEADCGSGGVIDYVLEYVDGNGELIPDITNHVYDISLPQPVKHDETEGKKVL